MLPAHERLRERRSRSASRDMDKSSSAQTRGGGSSGGGAGGGSQLHAKASLPSLSSVSASNTTTATTKSGLEHAGKEKTFMDRWMEPSLAQKPSYRDHGGVPYGVLEHMQPLGELPNAKVKARVKVEGGGGGGGSGGGSVGGGNGGAAATARKSLSSKALATTSGESAETPESTPVPGDARSSENSASVNYPDDALDADYAPTARGRPRGSVARRSTRGIAFGAANAAHKNGNSVHADRTKSTSPTATTGSASKGNGYSADKLRAVVEAAKARAIEVHKPDLAAAVNEIYEQSLHNSHLTTLLVSILTQDSTPEQTAAFQKYVRAAKKKLRAAKDKGRHQPRDAVTEVAGASSRGREQQRSTTSSDHVPAVTETAAATFASTEPPADVSKSMLSHKVKSPQKHARGLSSGTTNTPPKKRSRSVDSDSSLTSMTSNEDGMEVDDSADEQARPRSRIHVNGTVPKDHAAERGTLAAPPRGLKRSSAEAELQDDTERQLLIQTKKQKLSEKLHRDSACVESHIREPLLPPPPPPSNVLALPSTPATRTRAQQHAQQTTRAASLDHESPLSSPRSSRRASPRPDRGLVKPVGRRAKIKQSPEKKNVLGYTGLAGVSGAGLASPIGGDENEELSENNDFCSACGGSGFLLCCDGCDRSFHFTCLDPPLNEGASELNEPWFCYICVARRPVSAEQPDKPLRGLFAPLFINLRKRNPTNFSLPLEIRDYFEGVATDKEGHFIEAVHTRTRNRAGYDELPDYVKIKDAKGNTVLCHLCGKSSQGSRPIIQCDYCGQNWHLDCLDPPLANPPARSIEGKKMHDWMCLLHADQELRKLDTSLLYPRRRIHIRKPRNARIVEASLRRGFVNNGVIEVVDDSSDDSDSEFYEEETQDESIVYRLPASGIKLDFIDKVKNTRVQALRDSFAYKRTRVAAASAAPRQLDQANFARRSFREKQTALNLAQFANSTHDLDLGGDQVQNLLGILIAEAPTEVVEEMIKAEEAADAFVSSAAAIPPSPPSSEQTDQLSAAQRKQLELLQELIRRRLEGGKT